MKKAFSLAITLWISAILMAVSIYFLSISKKEINNDILILDKLNIFLLTKTKIEELKFYIASGRQIYNRVENSFTNYPSYILTDGTVYKDKNITYYIQDVGGLLHSYSLNNYEIEQITNEYNLSNYQITLDSYKDWIDKDDIELAHGAEAKWYKKNNYNYVPRNNKIYMSNELQDIRGWNNLFIKVKNKLAYGINTFYNYTAMNAEVLHLKYGISLKEAEKLIRIKKESLKNFLTAFNQISKRNFNYEIDTFFPSKIYKIKVQYKTKSTVVNLLVIFDAKNFNIRYGYF